MVVDPLEKALALQEKALRIAQEARDKEKQRKAMLWHWVKENDAQMADFIKSSHEIFGSPKYLKVTALTGEVIGEIKNDRPPLI